MHIELSKKEFRRLLDLVYIGNWILNSTRGDDRITDYDDLESKLFSLCHNTPMAALVERWNGTSIPSRPLPKAASMKRSLTMKTRYSSIFWPKNWRAGIWSTPPSPKTTTMS